MFKPIFPNIVLNAYEASTKLIAHRKFREILL